MRYRLSIAPSLDRYRSELEYACAFLDRCYHVERVDEAQTVLHYGPQPPAGAVAVPNLIFPDAVLVDSAGIHPKRPRPYKSDICTDTLGGIFFLLSRLEERESPWKDRYGRFPVQASLLSRLGCHAEPLADAAAHRLAQALTGLDDPPKRTTYTVRLTHDVDGLPGDHRPWQPIRYAIGDLVKRGQPRKAWHRLRRAYASSWFLRDCEWLMELAAAKQLQARFFFMGPSPHPMDSPYLLQCQPFATTLMRRIQDRGHLIGFHPGFTTATDPNEWHRQREGLEALAGPITEGRQHVLQYDADMAPNIWDQAGMHTDYTLAYPEQGGFRAGTCRPFQAYSLRHRRILSVVQVCTALMDFSYVGGKYRPDDPGQAQAEARHLIATCQHYGGTLAVLYHPGQGQPAQEWYEMVLAHV